MPLFSSVIPAPGLLVALVAGLVTLGVSVGACVVIERFIPQLLGQFPTFESIPKRPKRAQRKLFLRHRRSSAGGTV